jgi:hypothetical protein
VVAAETTPLLAVHGVLPDSNPPLTMTWSPHAAAFAAGAMTATAANPRVNAIATANGLRLIGRPFEDKVQGSGEKRDRHIAFVQRYVFAC